MGPFAQEVPMKSNYTLKPTTRMTDAREEASAYFLGRMIYETKRVRLANFQKWSRNSLVQVILMITWQVSSK